MGRATPAIVPPTALSTGLSGELCARGHAVRKHVVFIQPFEAAESGLKEIRVAGPGVHHGWKPQVLVEDNHVTG